MIYVHYILHYITVLNIIYYIRYVVLGVLVFYVIRYIVKLIIKLLQYATRNGKRFTMTSSQNSFICILSMGFYYCFNTVPRR